MTASFVLGLDVGTGGARGILYRPDGSEVATTHHGYGLATPRAGWAEQDPEEIWSAIVRTLADLAAQIPPGGEVSGIGLSSILHSFVGADQSGHSITPSMIWADTRAHAQVRELRQRLDPTAVYRRTGCPMHPMYLPGKISWLRQEQPNVFQNVRIFGSIKDDVIERLTGRRVVDRSVASGSGLYNFNLRTWDPEILAAIGISPDQLPPIVEPTDVVGGLAAEAARVTGLPAGTPIVAGAGDGVLSSLGAGAVAPGQMTVMIGTSGAARLPANHPVVDELARTWCYYLAQGTWIAGAAINNGGLACRWVRENLTPGPAVSTDEWDFLTLEHSARQAPPGAGGLLFLPFLTGERAPFWNASARGVLFGLAQHMGPQHVARATFEGVCFRMRSIVEALDQAAGPTVETRATGGFVRSAFWLQLLTDIIGRPMRLPDAPQASAFGAAGLALIGTGQLATLADVARLVSVAEGPVPNPAPKHLYDRAYQIYLDVYWANQASFAAIAALQEELS